MPTTLCQLIYVSAAAAETGRAGLHDILATSANGNSTHNVTGMLLYDRGSFLQVIEGPRLALTTLFDNICRDVRHHTVTHMLTHPVAQRDFADWTMAFPELTAQDLSAHAALRDFFAKGHRGFDQMNGTLAQSVLQGFRTGLFRMAASGRLSGQRHLQD